MMVALLLSTAPAAVAASPAEQIAALVAAGEAIGAAEVACAWAKAEPGNTEALRACADLGFEVGRYRQAEDSIRSLLFYTPNDPELLLMLGEVLLKRGRHAEAREQFEAAIYQGGVMGEAYVGLAKVALLDSEDPGDALSAAEMSVSLAPDHAPAHAMMAAALLEVGRYVQALGALERAREIAPDDARTLYELGLTLSMLGREQDAQEAWRGAVAASPHSAEAWLLRNRLAVAGVEEILDRAFDASYSPDGSRIAYRARGAGGWGVYTIPAESARGEEKLWATEDNIQSLAWSPDGTAIAVSVLARQPGDEGGTQVTRKVVLVPADGGETRELFEDRQLGEFAWHPLSGRLGVRHHQRGEGWRILKLDRETGEQAAITVSDRRRAHHHPSWSRDGSKLLAFRRGEQLPDGSLDYELVIGPADDFANAAVIFVTDQLPRGVTFSADGSVIVFALLDLVDQRINIWALPADGSRDPILVDHRAGPQGSLSLSPDGRYLLTTHGTMLVRATLAGLEED